MYNAIFFCSQMCSLMDVFVVPINVQPYLPMYLPTYKHTYIHTHVQTCIITHIITYRLTDTCRYTDRQTDRHTDWQTYVDIQTDRLTHICINICRYSIFVPFNCIQSSMAKEKRSTKLFLSQKMSDLKKDATKNVPN
jgi:hypothetical protein